MCRIGSPIRTGTFKSIRTIDIDSDRMDAPMDLPMFLNTKSSHLIFHDMLDNSASIFIFLCRDNQLMTTNRNVFLAKKKIGVMMDYQRSNAVCFDILSKFKLVRRLNFRRQINCSQSIILITRRG